MHYILGSNDLSMKFNSGKCKVMHVGRRNNHFTMLLKIQPLIQNDKWWPGPPFHSCMMQDLGGETINNLSTYQQGIMNEERISTWHVILSMYSDILLMIRLPSRQYIFFNKTLDTISSNPLFLVCHDRFTTVSWTALKDQV